MQFGLEEIANELGESLLKMNSTHGIRWAASQAKTVKALTADLPFVASDLEYRVKSEFCFEYTQLTPSNNFIRKTFTHEFEDASGHKTRWKGTVKSVTISPDQIAASDLFTIIYSDKRTTEMSKAELVSRLTKLDDPKLTGDSRWQLREKITAWRFVAFSYFMLDVHHVLAILSKSYQSNALVVFDISRHLNKALSSLKKLKSNPGDEEANFHRECAQNGDVREALAEEYSSVVSDRCSSRLLGRQTLPAYVPAFLRR